MKDEIGPEQGAFAVLAERHRRELRVHCYRMLGSYVDAEDLVQETFLRAWRKREQVQGPGTFRAWLYRIATNACIDALEKLPSDRQFIAPDGSGMGRPAAAIPWLQPMPDSLLDEPAPGEFEPESALVSRENIELAFLAAIQHLPPRQRATLILRDVIGWSASECAELLDVSVAAVNSALQRARETLKECRAEPNERIPVMPTDQERAALKRYMDAIEQASDEAIARVLRHDVRLCQQPGAGGNDSGKAVFIHGRDEIIRAWAPILHGAHGASLRFLPTAANRQPAAATYLRWPGTEAYLPFALAVLTVKGDEVSDIAIFGADTFPAFGLPASL
jgi:RNA polymerase sigma-70 factor, ECF subfamily